MLKKALSSSLVTLAHRKTVFVHFLYYRYSTYFAVQLNTNRTNAFPNSFILITSRDWTRSFQFQDTATFDSDPTSEIASLLLPIPLFTMQRSILGLLLQGMTPSRISLKKKSYLIIDA